MTENVSNLLLHFGNFGPSNHTPSRYSFTISSPSLASVLSNWNPSLHLAVQVLQYESVSLIKVMLLALRAILTRFLKRL